MTGKILLQIILFAIALSMDAFAVSVTDGLIYKDINKKRGLAIATTFGIMQGAMPLIGYWLVELIRVIVTHAQSGNADKAANILTWVVTIVAFVLLVFIGSNMFFEGIRELKKEPEEKTLKNYSYKEVFLMGIATAIDAIAVGVSLNAGLSTNTTIFLHVAIITVITFIICIFGVFLGKQIVKLLKGKVEISYLIGGSILILLAIWILVSHIFGL
ncbi:MAG: manganese efflux pump [Bacilli bacterium]|nr:manganese efflux pump [Bacilli bacterium]